MAQDQNQNQKSRPDIDSNYGNANVGANNPVKKDESERRDQRGRSDQAEKNLGGQKTREENVDTGRFDRSAR